MKKIKFDILTLFPEMFSAYVSESILKRAQESGQIEINLHNWREKSEDKHKNVDDKPYGGSAGMLLMVQPIYKQLAALKALPKQRSKKTHVLMMAPDGTQFDNESAVRLAEYDNIIILCGRYEGFDKRIEEFIDEKISIGPYVLSGGELPAMVVTEAVARQIPGVLGNEDTLKDETFTDGRLEYPQYTRPEIFEIEDGTEMKVPEILLSGDHAKIEAWRQEKSPKAGA